MTNIPCDEAHTLMHRAFESEADGPGGDMAPLLAAHLAECPACADAWEGQRLVRELLALREPAPVPVGFAARLEGALDDLTPWWLRVDWRWWTLRAAAPLAAALLLLVGGAATWTAASSPAPDGSSVTSALVDTSSSVSNDSLLLAVLSGTPDDTVSRYEGSVP